MPARQLLILRHAKSSWDDPKLADFDRPLAPRGQKTAPLIGRELSRRGWLPDLALVSPALRAR
ncbi:histidine phosphatase family protein, partial [Mesorhizobium sp. M2A.F.Ca.ET.040.01.1.1]